MPRLVAAPDKFRGTATAAAAAAAIGRAARSAGWEAQEVPLADGGEGTLEVVGGEVRRTRVSGPLGVPVLAEWRLLPAPEQLTAVIEMARAAGRSLVPSPTGTDPLRASTTGVGQLVLAAVDAGARRIVVGVGGSATTDGGWGAVAAIGSPDRLRGARVVVAADVRTRFGEAAERFGPQKGASPAQVAELTRRLTGLAGRYREVFGVDVETVEGAGAAGGLAGGLAALGAEIVPGFDLIADLVGLDGRLPGADLVVTGEGTLDGSSFDGKVVGEVMARVGDRAPVLCVAGTVGALDGDRLPMAPHRGLTVVSLVDRFGPGRARTATVALIEEVVSGHLRDHHLSGS